MVESYRADRALLALRNWAIDADNIGEGEAALRRRVVEGLEAVAERESKRTARQRRVWLGAAAACLFLVCGGLASLVRSGGKTTAHAAATLLSTEGKVTIVGQVGSDDASSHELSQGAEITTTRDSSALLSTAFGARVTVTQESRLVLVGERSIVPDRSAEQIRLLKGEVVVQVPELGERRGFEVLTPDATVIVHGTRFVVRVDRTENDQATTQVDVSSGRVEVRRKAKKHWLGPGSRWTSATIRPTMQPVGEAIQSAETDEPAKGGDGAMPSRARKSATASPRSSAAQSRLAEANRLMMQAMYRKRQGDDVATIERLDELLELYPDSPLAPNARLERRRALARLGGRPSSVPEPEPGGTLPKSHN